MSYKKIAGTGDFANASPTDILSNPYYLKKSGSHGWLERFRVNFFTVFFAVLILLVSDLKISYAQEIDILLKGGHVIDPKNKIDSKMDIAIANGKILRVAPNITAGAKKVIDAAGMFVTPGFVDIHVHSFWGTNGDFYNDGPSPIQPDGFTFRSGVTTVVDAGSMGWKTFPTFKKQTIDQSATRVLAFLNIVGAGMRKLYEQDTTEMDPKMAALAAKLYKDHVVGIKTAHFYGSFEGVERAVEAGKQANIPVIVDFGDADPILSIKELLLNKLRPGDIYTHAFTSVALREHIIDSKGVVKPFVFEAQKRGVIFDVGMGGGSMGFNQLIPATRQGFWPNTISTDLHSSSMNAGMKSMANVMSMFLNLGMSIQDVIDRTTLKPAKVINREELGNLSVGADADIAVFKIVKGKFGFQDAYGKKFDGTMRLQNELTFRAGKVVWNLNGMGAEMWDDKSIQN